MVLRPETSIKINYIGIKGFNDAADDLLKTIEKITQVLGKGIELKVSCLNPTDFAQQNKIISVNQFALEDLAKIAEPFHLKRVYTFGPMSN